MFAVTRCLTRLLAVAAILSTGACQAWKVDNRPVPVALERASHERVAITMNDARWVVLDGATLQSDSIVGMRVTGNTRGIGRTALSLHGVRAVETRRFSITRTLGLGVVALFVPTLYRFAVVE